MGLTSLAKAAIESEKNSNDSVDSINENQLPLMVESHEMEISENIFDATPDIENNENDNMITII